MRYILLLAYVLVMLSDAAGQQARSITISLGELTCKFRSDFRPDAEKAFELMSKLYSSEEFQDSLRRLTFPDNSCNSCGSDKINSGSAVLEQLFLKTNETLDLVIKKGGGALGKTSPQANYTTAFYKNIRSDMCKLPFFVGLAVNLSHEYMHHICFCHPKDPIDTSWRKPFNGNHCDDEKYDPINYRTDIAYRVGWIAYDILLRWYKEGKIAN
jgi:hypothetical protein